MMEKKGAIPNPRFLRSSSTRNQGSNEVAPCCVGDFLVVPAAGAMSGGARVCDGPAARRRDRRLRQWLRHERLSIRMNVAEMRHHAAPQPTNIHVGTQTATPVIECMAPSPAMTDITSLMEPHISFVLTEYVVPAPAATYAATTSLVTLTEDVTPAPSVSHTTPAPVIEHMAAPVIEYIAHQQSFSLRSGCPMKPSPVL